MPPISCIIVSHNNGEFLKDAIISVLQQTLPVTEIIVADDGSTDGSRNLIMSLAQDYQQIQPIFREKNLGVAANRDLAIRSATGHLITTLDGDDWYFPEKIEKEFLAIQDKFEAIAYSDVQLVHPEEVANYCWSMSEFSKLNRRERLHWLAHRLGFIPRDMLFPKKLYLEAGGMQHNLDMYEDWDLKIRLAAMLNSWLHSGVVGLNYRRTSLGLSNNRLLRHFKCQYQVLLSNQELIKKHLGVREFWLCIANLVLLTGRSWIKKNILS